MDETVLKWAALGSAVIGLFALIHIVLLYPPIPGEVKEIYFAEDRSVSMEGVVESSFKNGEVMFIELMPKKPVKIVSFKPISLSHGMEVLVTGRLKEYKGEKEVILEKVEWEKD